MFKKQLEDIQHALGDDHEVKSKKPCRLKPPKHPHGIYRIYPSVTRHAAPRSPAIHPANARHKSQHWNGHSKKCNHLDAPVDNRKYGSVQVYLWAAWGIWQIETWKPTTKKLFEDIRDLCKPGLSMQTRLSPNFTFLQGHARQVISPDMKSYVRSQQHKLWGIARFQVSPVSKRQAGRGSWWPLTNWDDPSEVEVFCNCNLLIASVHASNLKMCGWLT